MCLIMHEHCIVKPSTEISAFYSIKNWHDETHRKSDVILLLSAAETKVKYVVQSARSSSLSWSTRSSCRHLTVATQFLLV